MRKIVTAATLVLFACLTPTILLGQAFQYPSEDRVEELLNQIEYCKQELKNVQVEIKTMENNASNYSLAEYQESEKLVDRIKLCIANARSELDSIRKEYPGWFNSPNAVLPYNRHQQITPTSLEERLKDLERKISQVLNQFQGLPKPEGR